MGTSARLILVGFVALACGVAVILGGQALRRAYIHRSAPPLEVRLDARGPYAILATRAAAASYGTAIDGARALHPGAVEASLDPLDPGAALAALAPIRPRYALIFVMPDELDVRLAWRWLEASARLDADPFVDVRAGFVTGESPTATAAFVRRIAAAARGESKLPAALVDNFGPIGGPGEGATPDDFLETEGAPMTPSLAGPLAARSIHHGPGRAFGEARRDSMRGAGILHFGGHGYPDGIVLGLSAAQARALELSPCVVLSGACYTGVTGRWYDPFCAAPTAAAAPAHTVGPDASFCLNLLGNNLVGYLAALHPDHGIPVYQEMEHLFSSGASLGDAVKSTYDGVVLGAGGRLPRLEIPGPGATPSEIMLVGSSSRVLFGDPALIVTRPLVPPPFNVTVAFEGDDVLRIRAVLAHPEHRSSLTDTYHADLAGASGAPYDERALVTAPLPASWTALARVEVAGVTAGGRPLEWRLVGWAVEEDQGERRLHVQVDMPASGFMDSPFRVRGATVEISARR